MTRCTTCGGLVGADEDEAPALSPEVAAIIAEGPEAIDAALRVIGYLLDKMDALDNFTDRRSDFTTGLTDRFYTLTPEATPPPAGVLR